MTLNKVSEPFSFLKTEVPISHPSAVLKFIVSV
jgi:hypothetical protein